MNKTAVIIPCYNEEKTIGKVVTDFRRELPDADIYVYDNNSTDRSVEIMRELSSDKVHLCFEHRQGKGNVVRRMFREVDADCYIMVDADDTYPAESASVLEKAVLEKDCDMAVGDRLSGTYYTENKRPFHNLGNNLVRDMVNHFFRSNLHDIMTGFRAMSKDFVKTYAVLCEGFEIETDMTIFALDNGFLIKEFPIEYRDRPMGSESKLNTYSDGFKVIMTIARLLRDVKPLKYFSVVGTLLLLLSAGFFIPVLREYLATGLVSKMPTLIMVSMTTIASLMAFFTGILLQVLRRYYKADIERTRNLLRR